MVLRSAREPDSAARTVPAFLIIGSTRSGTTLVQRLASELPGVAIPPETHFFTHLASTFLSAPRPLNAERLRPMLQEYVGLRVLEGLEVDVEGVLEDLGGTCDSALELFAAILRRLAGDASTIGEKTPLHLFWWRPISRAMPEVRFVATVRDPRGMVASNMAVRWGPGSPVLLAESWAIAQSVIARAANELGPERMLVLRYEDVVADPNASRLRIAEHLGLEPGPAGGAEGSAGRNGPGYLPWESWKEQAWGPIQTDRAEAWRSSLSPRQSAEITAICRRGMARFGYREDRPGAGATLAALARMSPMVHARRLAFRRKWRRHAKRIDGTTLSDSPLSVGR